MGSPELHYPSLSSPELQQSLQMVSEPTILGFDSAVMTDFGLSNSEPYPYAYHYSNDVLRFFEFSDGSIRAPSTSDLLSEVLKLVRKQRRILDQMITPAESKEKQQTSNDIDIPNEHQFPNSDGVEVLEKIDEPSSGVEYGNTEGEGGTFIEIVSDSSIKKLKSSMETVGKEKQEYLELKVTAELVENLTINSVNSVQITSSMISNWDVGIPLETKNCEEKNVDDNELRVFDKSFQRKETQLLLRLAYEKQNLIPFSYHSSLVTNEDGKPPSLVKLVEEPWRENIIYGVSSNMLDEKPKGKVEIQRANDASSRKMDMVYVENSFTVGDVDSNASKPRKIYEGTELEGESKNAGNDANLSYDKMLSVDAHLFICVPKVPVMCSYYQFGHSVHFAALKMGIGGNFVSCHYTKCMQNRSACEVFDEILSGKLKRAHCAWMAETEKGFWHSMLVLAEAWDVHDFKLLDTEPRSLNSIPIEAVVMFDKIFAEMLHKGMVPDLVIISSFTWKGESEKKLQLSMFALTGSLFLCDFKLSSYGCWIFLLYVHSQVHVVEDFTNVINVWNHNLDMRDLLVQSKKQSIRTRVTRLNFGNDCGMYKCTLRDTGQDTMICKILDSGQGVMCSRQSKWKSFYPTLKCLLAVEINLMKEIGYEVVYYGNNIHFSGDAVAVKMVMGCIVLCNQEGVVLHVTWMIWVVSSTARGQQQVEVFIWLFELSVYSSFIVILFLSLLSLYSLLNMIGFAKQKYANDILKLSEERVESVVKANGITHVGLPMAYTHFTTVAISGVDVVEDKVLADIHITETHESNSRVILIIEVPYVVSEDCYIRVIMEFMKHSKIRGCCPLKEVLKGILVDYVEKQTVQKKIATYELLMFLEMLGICHKCVLHSDILKLYLRREKATIVTTTTMISRVDVFGVKRVIVILYWQLRHEGNEIKIQEAMVDLYDSSDWFTWKGVSAFTPTVVADYFSGNVGAKFAMEKALLKYREVAAIEYGIKEETGSKIASEGFTSFVILTVDTSALFLVCSSCSSRSFTAYAIILFTRVSKLWKESVLKASLAKDDNYEATSLVYHIKHRIKRATLVFDPGDGTLVTPVPEFVKDVTEAVWSIQICKHKYPAIVAVASAISSSSFTSNLEDKVDSKEGGMSRFGLLAFLLIAL